MKKVSIFLATISFFTKVDAQDFESFRVGNQESVTVNVQYGLLAAGGATDNDDAMRWLLQRAIGGDVLVLRTSGADGYNNYLFSQLNVNMNSVETIVCNNRNASFSPYLKQRLLEAEIIFFAGGNQATYVEYWKNTPVDSIINKRAQNFEIAIGGTSAGAAILGEGYFSASNGTVTSALAIDDPFNMFMTLGKGDFLKLPFAENIIFDTHFNNPDRRGRLAAFVARLMNPADLAFRGIGINEFCAVAISTDGNAICFGEFPDYQDDEILFLRSDCVNPTFPQQLLPGMPLIWQYFDIVKMKADRNQQQKFNINTWDSFTGQGTFKKAAVSNLTFQEFSPLESELCEGATSVNEHLSNKYSLKFQNPFGKELNIFSDELISGTLTVYDIQGKKVVQQILENTNSVNVTTRAFANGIYLIQIRTQSGEIVTLKGLKN